MRLALAFAVLALTLTLGTRARADDPPKPAPPVPPPSPVVVGGFVHADWVVFRQSSQDEVNTDGEPLNENRFMLRRGRMRISSDRGLTFAAAEIEANTVAGPQVRPINVEGTLKWPESRPAFGPTVDPRALPDGAWFQVSAGLIQNAFGFEPMEFAIRRPFLEQTAMTTAFFPGQFDLGARLLGGYKVVNWGIGIMNGSPIGDRTFPGRDPNESKDLVFRVGASTALTPEIHVEGGLSGLTGRGFHRGRPATNDRLVWRDLNEDTIVDPIELQSISGSPAEPSQTFRRFAMGADLRVFVALPVIGELAIRAEIVRASNLDRGLYVADPVASTYDLRELGWYAGFVQEITRWAHVGVRYDHYNPDADAREREPFALVPRDLSLSTWSFMAAARLPYGRLVGQYDVRSNALGRTAGGVPTTLADDSFTLRVEAKF
jgi:hypothetical protein